MSALSPISEIIEDIRAGKMVVLVDEEDRENEGDIVMAAECVTPEAINFMAQHARGLVCLTLTEARCHQLGLSQMVRHNNAPLGTAFTASIEAAQGVTTGISAFDRAHTIRTAVARNAKSSDLVQPGHVFPIMARPGGVLIRAGHTEAGCDLAGLAGMEPAAVICEVMNDDGSMARLSDLVPFAAKHGLKIGAIRDLIEYRAATEVLVARRADKLIETPHGPMRLTAFEDMTSKDVHFALVKGEIHPDRETLVRVHEPLSVIDFLGVNTGLHRFTVNTAMARIAAAEQGVIVFLYRPQTGQDLLSQLSTHSEEPSAKQWDPRLFGVGAQMLKALNVGKMRLLASERKIPSMAGFGLEICGFEHTT